MEDLLVRKEDPEQIYVLTLFRKTIIQFNYNSEYCGYSSINKTLDLVSRSFFLPKILKYTLSYVKDCRTCTNKKDNRHKEYGTVVRVLVIVLFWQELQRDFITDFPVKK